MFLDDNLSENFEKADPLASSILGISGGNAANQAAQAQIAAANQAIPLMQQAGAEQQALLTPFQQAGQQGVEQANFLTDPQAQFDFLQNNPLFAQSLQNANTNTMNLAASRGRLSAGDTLQQLSDNTLLSAAPLIAGQKSSINDLLGLGERTAINQGNQLSSTAANVSNLITGRGASEAAGIVGQTNSESQGVGNVLDIVGSFFSSDRRLKESIKSTGSENGFNTYSWSWNELAYSKFGLTGISHGVIADEVEELVPDAVDTDEDGYQSVNYEMIGVEHG